MKTIHLLAVDAPPDRFATLIESAQGIGLRVGWLDLATMPEVPPALETAAVAGAFRSVAVTGQGTLAAKRVGGGVRIEDLLREHFLGCRLVLVRGEVAAPRLEERADGWRIEAEGATIELSTAELAARLRRPATTFLDCQPPK